LVLTAHLWPKVPSTEKEALKCGALN
jgi:hypothetical protein